MKSLQSILLWVVAAAVAVLYVLHFSGNKKTGETKNAAVKKDSTDDGMPQHIRVAYIDLDTVQKYYEFFKLKNDELEREKNRFDNQIQGELNKIYVLRKYHKQGIGIKLFRLIVSSLISKGINNMILFTDYNNPTIKFFERLGGKKTLSSNGESHDAYTWNSLDIFR